MKALGHSAREHHDFRTVLQQFLHISDLNTGTVRGVCVAPIPFTRAAGEKLCVFVRFGLAFDFQATPRNVINSRRTIAALHIRCHSERSEESRFQIPSQSTTEIDQRCFASLNMTALLMG